MRTLRWVAAAGAIASSGCTITAAGDPPPATGDCTRNNNCHFVPNPAAMQKAREDVLAAAAARATAEREAASRAQAAATANPPATTASAWVPGMGAAPLRTWSVAAAPEAPESGAAMEQRRQRVQSDERRDAVAQSRADAAPCRAYAKAHCKVVEKASQSVWTDTTVDGNGLVHVTPVVVYDYLWHCPKGSPAGIEGKDEDSDLAGCVVPR